MTEPTLVLIDGANYAFRAYHGLPRLTNSTGRAIHAAFGWANLLARYVSELRPTFLAIAWDPPGPNRRKLRYEPYKAQRKPIEPELLEQLPLFEPIAQALGIPFLSITGFEADDVMATLAHRFRGRCRIEILSTDKDLMQMVGDGVVLVDTIRGKTYDPAAVEEKWGVPPVQLRDALALMGDTSDNIPGVAGIGEKTAAALVRKFGSVDEILRRVPEVEPARARNSLAVSEEVLRLSLELVTLDLDVPIPFDLDDLRLKGADTERCQRLFSELEFNSLLKKFGGQKREASVGYQVWGEGSPDQLAGEAPLYLDMVPGIGGGVAAVAAASGQGPIHVWTPGEGELARVKAALFGLATPGRLVGYDVKGGLAPLLRGEGPFPLPAGDVLIESWIGQSGRTSHELVDLAAGLLGVKLEDTLTAATPELPRRLAERLSAVRDLHARLRAEIEAQGSLEVLTRIELPLIPVLAAMEDAGVQVDTSVLSELSRYIDAELSGLMGELRTLAGDLTFNPGSPKQLQKVLFEDLGLKVVKRTKTGPSTDSSVLEELADEHPLPEKILLYRSLSKLKNTYVDTLPALVRPATGRIHTTFNQAVAATGRLSSSDPNLQNIPIRTPLGRQIRRAFVAPPGWKLLSADYSQIELRLMAHLSGDERMRAAFHEGQDIHARTAAEMYNLPPEQITPDLRRAAKAINFGILYGMGAHRLARDLGIPRKEAQAFIDRYFERFAGVRAWLDATIAAAHKDEYVSTLFGRRRYLPEINSRQFNVRANAERMATNAPLQGSAADLIKIAMVSIHDQMQREGLGARMLLQVHDELLFEAPPEELGRLEELVVEQMSGAAQLSVPLKVDVGIGTDWASSH